MSDEENTSETPLLVLVGSDGEVLKEISRTDFIESMKGDDVDPEAVEMVLGSVLDDEEE